MITATNTGSQACPTDARSTQQHQCKAPRSVQDATMAAATPECKYAACGAKEYVS
jgi:hypothetical protein